MKDYRELKVWQRSHALTQAVYSLTKQFPKEESADSAKLTPENLEIRRMLGAFIQKLKA